MDALTTTNGNRLPQNGCETSSRPGSSQTVKSTPVQLSMFAETICEASRNAISSPGSADGHTHSGLQDGRMIAPCGPDHVRVSHGVKQVNGKAPTTLVTFGLNGSASSASVGLQGFLESRLTALLPGCGSTLFTLTWKRLTTPLGRSFSLLRASAPRKDATGLGSWQTPTTRDGKGESGKGNRIRRGRNGRLHVANLCDQLVDLGRRDLVRSSTFRAHLMGFPTSWEDAAPTATRSSRKSPLNSSKQ